MSFNDPNGDYPPNTYVPLVTLVAVAVVRMMACAQLVSWGTVTAESIE